MLKVSMGLLVVVTGVKGIGICRRESWQGFPVLRRPSKAVKFYFAESLWLQKWASVGKKKK